MNSGVQDSVNLGWTLALVHKGLASPKLLDTYTEERLPVIAAMLEKTTKLLNKTVSVTTDDSAWHRGGELRQLGINYRWSSIVVDEKKPVAEGEEEPVDPYRSGEIGVVRGGNRAPDAPSLLPIHGPGVVRLFQVFHVKYHTALIFVTNTDNASPVLKSLQAYPKGLIRAALIIPAGPVSWVPPPAPQATPDYVLADLDGYATKAYDIAFTDLPADGFKVVVVRPDGVVGAIVSGIDNVKKYFEGIFVA
jgi:hypothetical protein